MCVLCAPFEEVDIDELIKQANENDEITESIKKSISVKFKRIQKC